MIGEHTKGGLAAAFIYGESDYLTIERIERDVKACAAIRGTEKVIIDAQSAMELHKRDRADALSLCIYHSVRTPSMMMAPARAAISSGVSFAPPESHSSVSVRLPETMKEQK